LRISEVAGRFLCLIFYCLWNNSTSKKSRQFGWSETECAQYGQYLTGESPVITLKGGKI